MTTHRIQRRKRNCPRVTTISTLRLSASRHAFSNRGWRNQIEAANSKAVGGKSWSRIYSPANKISAAVVVSPRLSAIFARAGVSTLAITRMQRFPFSSVSSRVFGFPSKGRRTVRPIGCIRALHRQSPPTMAAAGDFVSPGSCPPTCCLAGSDRSLGVTLGSV